MKVYRFLSLSFPREIESERHSASVRQRLQLWRHSPVVQAREAPQMTTNQEEREGAPVCSLATVSLSMYQWQAREAEARNESLCHLITHTHTHTRLTSHPRLFAYVC